MKRTAVSELEQNAAKRQHTSLERQIIGLQTGKIELESRLREKEMAVERLERDRRYFAERDAEHTKARDTDRAEKKALDAELRTLRSTVAALREDLADLRDEHSSLQRSSSLTISQHQSTITTLHAQNASLQQQFEQSRQLAQAHEDALIDLQGQLDHALEEKDGLQSSRREDEGMGVVRDELHRQADYLRQLESTNTRLERELTVLRDRQTSVQVLREKNRDLEAKLQVTDALRLNVAQLQAELDARRLDTPQPSTPTVDLTQILSSLRLDHAHLLEEHGSTTATLRHLESQHANLQSQHSSALSTIESLTASIKLLKDKIHRRDGRIKSLDKELSFLNAMLKSYENEVELPDESTRVQHLESLLDEYKSTNTSLLTQIESPKPTASHEDLEKALAESESLTQSLEEATKQVESHLETIDNLEQQLFELSGEIAGGRHIPPKTRILCLSDNPESQWFNLRQQSLDKLKAENEALLRRLKDLESITPSNTVNENIEGMVPRQSLEILSQENQQLQQSLQQREKRLVRLQQIFASKSAEFREAITSILGVKLAFYQNGQVRVTSVFDLNASFVFQPKEEGGMKMQLVAKGEGGPQDLPEMMRYWIEGEQSLPGFMASVTLECWDKEKERRNSN